jgi:hypothetical protein
MPCKPIRKYITQVDIDTELTYQYDRLRMIFNNDEEHPYMKGFKQCMDTVRESLKLNQDANTNTNTIRV